MKFILDDFEAAKVEKNFVDRIAPRQVFWQHYEKANAEAMESPLVLSYYGVSGVGKTALIRQLKKELIETYPEAKYLELDFDFAERRESYRILAWMRKKLAEKYKFTFPMFEVAYYSLMLRLGEAVEKPEMQSMINSSPVLSFLCDSGSFESDSEIISDVFRLTDEGVTLFQNSFSKRKHMLQNLMTNDLRQLLSDLPIYFAVDLRENLAKETHPFVMFLDTYEKLVNTMAVIGDPLRNDLWLRGEKGILARLPNVIWVISGREELRWEQLDVSGHWDGVLHSYLLDTLSQQDAAEFLTHAGVTDVAAQQEIYRQTNGLPVYLDLCAEQYLQDGTTAVNQDVLFARCTRYMDDPEKNILFLLSCLGTWTQDSAYAAGKQMPFDFSPVFYVKLLGASFVLTEDGVHYTLMDPVGKVLREHCPSVIRRACMEWMVQVEKKSETMDIPRYMQLLLEDIHSQDDLNAVMDKLEDTLVGLIESYQLVSFYEYLEPLWRIASNKYQESDVFAQIWTLYSMALYKTGEYEMAEQFGLQALEQLQQGKGAIDAIRLAATNMAVQYSERCFFQKIPPLLEPLWKELSNTMGEEHFVSQEIAHMIAVAYGVLEQKEAEVLWETRFDREKIENPQDGDAPTETEAEIAAMQEEALRRWEAKDYQGYVDHQIAAINRAQELFGVHHLQMLLMMEDLAKKLNAIAMHEDAIAIQQAAVKRYTDSIGLHDGRTTMARMALYQYLSEADRVKEAMEMAPEIIADLTENYGAQFAATLNFRMTVFCDKMLCKDREVTREEDLREILRGLQELKKEMLESPTPENTKLDQVEELIAALQGDYPEEPVIHQKVSGIVSVEAARIQMEKEPCVSDIWLFGDPMEKRIKKAVNTYAVDIDDTEVLLQVDGSVRRNGKAGFVFTKDMFFFKVLGEEGSAAIKNIEDVRAGKAEVHVYLRGRKSPIKVITAQDVSVTRVLRNFLGLDE